MSVKFQARIRTGDNLEIRRIPLEFLTVLDHRGHLGRFLTKKELKEFFSRNALKLKVFYSDGSGSFTIDFDSRQIELIPKYVYYLKPEKSIFRALYKLDKKFSGFTSMWDHRYHDWKMLAGHATELHYNVEKLRSLARRNPYYGIETYVRIDSSRYILNVRKELLVRRINPAYHQPDTIFSLLKQYFTKKPKVNVVYTFPGLQEKTVKLHINENVSYQD